MVFENEGTFNAMRKSRRLKESVLSNEELEFDNGESPDRDV
jgi:hypothetical protein